MDLERVRAYFNEPATVQHYMKAVANVGLWRSEKLLFNRHFGKNDRLLDLGCGVGRVAFGLWREGFLDVTGADLADLMVREAREVGGCLECPFPFRREDATALSLEDRSFAGVIFSFNGLMQIPGRMKRRQALGEIWRVLRPGSSFVFSTLDREDGLYARVFAVQDDPEHDLSQNHSLLDFGDRHFATEHGTTFMHVPTRSEVLEDLESAGFELVEDFMRSALASEPPEVLAFSEDCRMWVARRPL